MHPFLSFASEDTISYRLVEELGKKFDISDQEIQSAVHAAWEELAACRRRYASKGEEVINSWMRPETEVLYWQDVHITLTRRLTMAFQN